VDQKMCRRETQGRGVRALCWKDVSRVSGTRGPLIVREGTAFPLGIEEASPGRGGNVPGTEIGLEKEKGFGENKVSNKRIQ